VLRSDTLLFSLDLSCAGLFFYGISPPNSAFIILLHVASARLEHRGILPLYHLFFCNMRNILSQKRPSDNVNFFSFLLRNSAIAFFLRHLMGESEAATKLDPVFFLSNGSRSVSPPFAHAVNPADLSLFLFPNRFAQEYPPPFPSLL